MCKYCENIRVNNKYYKDKESKPVRSIAWNHTFDYDEFKIPNKGNWSSLSLLKYNGNIYIKGLADMYVMSDPIQYCPYCGENLLSKGGVEK